MHERATTKRRLALYVSDLKVQVFDSEQPQPHETTEREACLRIITQPALLEACKTLLPLLEHAERCESSADDGNGERLRMLRRQLNQVRSAIAKAHKE